MKTFKVSRRLSARVTGLMSMETDTESLGIQNEDSLDSLIRQAHKCGWVQVEHPDSFGGEYVRLYMFTAGPATLEIFANQED